MLDILKSDIGILFFAVFALTGTIRIIKEVWKIIYRKKYCTYETSAVCVDLKRKLKSSGNDTRVIYYPVYEFEYGGETKRVKGKKAYYRSSCPPVGSLEFIHVDPEHPKDFYVDNPHEGVISSIITGVICAAPAYVILIWVLLSN